MKVLLITHNPICTDSNMGKTLHTLFSQFSKEELCQLYVHPSLPDIDACQSYYRITDRQALKGVYTLKARGSEVFPETERRGASAVRQSAHRAKPWAWIGRDAVWKCSHWYSKELCAWLDREAPTHIFLAPGYAGFIYRIALRIAKERALPLVTYICDDYYFLPPSRSLWSKLHVWSLKKSIRAVMKQTARLVAICDELRDTYRDAFGVSAVTVMTGATSLQLIDEALRSPETVAYFGNLDCRRNLSLQEVGRALERINQAQGTAYRLCIYTGEEEPAVLRGLSEISTIRMGGFVTGDAFDKAMSQAALLLHVEAFDRESIERVRFSVSTKIPESLAGGIPLFAYAPAEVASMRHLMRHDCAFTVTEREALPDALQSALTDMPARERVLVNAAAVARTLHDEKKNSTALRELILSCS